MALAHLHGSASGGLERIGDHPALDLLNTVVQVAGAPRDLWQSDADVLGWLARADLLVEGRAPAFESTTLLAAARRLRELVRKLVRQRKAGEPLHLTAFNAFLAKARRYLELEEAGDDLQLVERYEQETPEQLLAPLAEAAAELLATGDFDLIRKCEGADCVLWFYDRTKAHRRRWCSMAACGNRHKVANFRRRRAG